MTRRITRSPRLLLAAVLAAGLMGVVPTTALGRVPADRAQAVWQHVCERAAGGTLSDQPALVCDHFGEPQWSPARIELLTRFCTNALGGRPEVRSQYPQELVACFF
jgi:hypothetical protein